MDLRAIHSTMNAGVAGVIRGAMGERRTAMRAAGGAWICLLLALIVSGLAYAQRPDNWVQRAPWTDREIVAAYNRSPLTTRTPMTNDQILFMYRASQGAPFEWRIHMGHGDPHFALRFNAELHGYNPQLVNQMVRTPHGRVSAQTFVNRAYSAGAGAREGNVTWELAPHNVSVGARSGGTIVNNRTAMAALQQMATHYPGTRTTTGGPYMADIDAALAGGQKVVIRFKGDGFEFIPRGPAGPGALRPGVGGGRLGRFTPSPKTVGTVALLVLTTNDEFNEYVMSPVIQAIPGGEEAAMTLSFFDPFPVLPRWSLKGEVGLQLHPVLQAGIHMCEIEEELRVTGHLRMRMMIDNAYKEVHSGNPSPQACNVYMEMEGRKMMSIPGYVPFSPPPKPSIWNLGGLLPW